MRKRIPGLPRDYNLAKEERQCYGSAKWNLQFISVFRVQQLLTKNLWIYEPVKILGEVE